MFLIESEMGNFVATQSQLVSEGKLEESSHHEVHPSIQDETERVKKKKKKRSFARHFIKFN